MQASISVVINTLNEERNLPYALRSVLPWAHEIIVVDMHSRDRTVQIAEEFGVKVVFHEGPGFNYAPREFAVAQASCEWTLVLDADELIPVSLSRQLKDLAESDRADVVILPRKNYLLGASLQHTAWGPEQDPQTRFFKAQHILASSSVHEDFKPGPGARVVRLPYSGDNAIIHSNYLDFAQFVDKLNRYTTLAADQAHQRGQRFRYSVALGSAVREFGLRYLIRGGYRDGWRGFWLSLFMVFYRLLSYAKLNELEAVGRREVVEQIYNEEAERVLNGYSQKVGLANSS